MKKLFTLLLLFVLVSSVNANEFKYRGFHIDLRNEVMTMDALEKFATKLAKDNFNTILMEYEATFPFDNHAVVSSRNAYSREEIKHFVKYCSNLGIDVIPMQQNFGHVEYILRHDRYKHLAENKKDLSQICPIKEDGCVALFAELFADMMSLHPSQFFHIGGDETYLLGQCKECAAKVVSDGKSKLFVDYMKKMCELVLKNGKTPIMWADIILKYPESIADLPKETIFVDWNYGWAINHFGDVEALIAKGAKFWGAPAIRSHPDDIYTTTWSKHFENQRDFIPHCRKLGYQGVIMTSWSTSGLYSTIWEQNTEVMDLLPQRNVYPMSGFDILINTYKIAINQSQSIDIKEVIEVYCVEQLGVTKDEAKDLQDLFLTVQTAWRDGQPTSGLSNEQVVQQCQNALNVLTKIKVKNGKDDLKHWILMFEIRKNHAQFKQVEQEYQNDSFSRGQAHILRDKLAAIAKQSDVIGNRFAELNKGYITDIDIQNVNIARSRKIKETLARLEALVK